MRALILAALLGFLTASTANVTCPSGNWAGSWTKNGDTLDVTTEFHERAGACSGSFSSDDLQVAGIPFSDVRLDGTHVHFVLRGDATTAVFDGEISDAAMVGTFAEGDDKGAFTLRRDTTPQAAPSEREVSFKSGDATIAGTLLVPSTTGKHPAIRFLHGSGAEGRWASRYLAQKFARAGFVALITDKRGVGQSTGDWKTSDFDDLASDAVAGVRFLQAQPEVDPKRVGIYGHSQGGTIAPLVAERAGDLAFVVAAAASGLDPAETETYSVENSVGIKKLSPSEAKDAREFVQEIVAVAYKGKPRTHLDELAERFKGRAWYFNPPPPDGFYWAFSRRIASYNPAEHWRKLSAPAFLVFGALDERVPPERSSQAILAALSAKTKAVATLKIIQGADHAVRLPQARPGGWQKRVPRYADMLIDWVRAHSGS